MPGAPRPRGTVGAGDAADPRDDAALLAAHVAGDRDAFGVLARRHADRLWRVAYGVLGDREEAADAVQDAVVSALRAADRFRGDAAVTTWLHRITVNASLDRLRRAKVRRTVPLEGVRGPDDDGRALEHAAPGDAAADVDLGVDVRAVLALLPPHQREALVLVDLEDLPVARAAELLGVAVGTVKSRCSRGRAAMAVMLRERGLDPSRGGAGPAAPGGGRADVAPDGGNPHGPRHVPEDGSRRSGPPADTPQEEP